MGTSVITIRVVGNHGCQREVKHGEIVAPVCERGEECARTCVDAQARKAVEALKATGSSIIDAHLMHWPEAGGGPHIVDDLTTGKRCGNFAT